jgi:invasion protein IalB
MQDSSVVATPDRWVAGIAAISIAATVALPAAAQQPAPKAEMRAQAQKGQPKSAPAPEQPQTPGDRPQVSFVPWTKICQQGTEANAIRVCLTGKDGRVESGMPVVAAVLIEPEGQPRKILRITLPLGMALKPGTRVIIDSGQPMNAPYVTCIPNGCVADYEASEELIGNLKRGRNLHVQGINASGQPITMSVPLADFAKAYDGPPTDPKQLPAR